MYSTGAWGLHLGNKNDIVKTLGELPGDVLVFGNIDPAGIIRMASPEVVGAEVTRLLEATAAFPNFVLSSGCDIPAGVPPANIDAYQAALDQYNSGR
jgi:uroporphyrinogen decarboxylase